MCKNNPLFWYCMLLLIALSSELQPNSTNDENENDYSTVRYQLDTNVTIDDEEDLARYNSRKNFTKDNDNTQNGYRINFTNSLEDEDLMYLAHVEKNENDSQMAIESRSNSTEPDEGKNFMSQEIHENMNSIKDKNDSTSHSSLLENFNEDNNEDNMVLNKRCDNITCIRLCCPFGQRLVNGKCTAILDFNFVLFSNMILFIHNDTLQAVGKRLNKISLFIHDPCQKSGHYLLDGEGTQHVFRVDGSLYLLYYKTVINPTSYCLAVDFNKYVPNVCLEIMQNIMNNTVNNTVPFGISTLTEVNIKVIILVLVYVINILISLVIFMVYSMPELRNIRNFALRGYSGLLFIGYTVDFVTLLIRKEAQGFFICIVSAYVQYYCYVGFLFWLNVLNFDIWYSFRRVRLLKENIKRQEKKKFIGYFLYAFGGPVILSIICAFMDFVPGLPENLIRPGFNSWTDSKCWFAEMRGNLLYYHQINVICVIISTLLSICTSRKISHYKKDVEQHLKSRRYNDNKQWFKLTAKATTLLFILFCIRTYMYVIYTVFNEISIVFPFTILALDVIQNIFIFNIFICKKKIMLLLKRFGCQKCGTSRRTKTTTTD